MRQLEEVWSKPFLSIWQICEVMMIWDSKSPLWSSKNGKSYHIILTKHVQWIFHCMQQRLQMRSILTQMTVSGFDFSTIFQAFEIFILHELWLIFFWLVKLVMQNCRYLLNFALFCQFDLLLCGRGRFRFTQYKIWMWLQYKIFRRHSIAFPSRQRKSF